MDIYERAENISSQQDFLVFLKKDFEENKSEWENDELMNFLEGLLGYCYDRTYKEVSWKAFAEILLAATVYE